MTDRYFTREDAQEMVGWLEETFQALAPLRDTAKRLYDEIRTLERMRRSNGGGKVTDMLELRRRDLAKTTERIEEQIRPVRERGLVVKSIEDGVVDFPHVREGRVVSLCWLVGEPEVLLARPGGRLCGATAGVIGEHGFPCGLVPHTQGGCPTRPSYLEQTTGSIDHRHWFTVWSRTNDPGHNSRSRH